jgi:gluconolactonase
MTAMSRPEASEETKVALGGWSSKELASGLGWPEGPAILDDGRVAFVETFQGQVSVWDREHGVQQFCDTGGGPNAAALGSDGLVYITQNGGIVGPWRSPRTQPPSIQRISTGRTASVVTAKTSTRTLSAPNDLAFGPDGNLYFTDPGGEYDPGGQPDFGYICVLKPDSTCEVLQEVGRVYPNGIVVEADGSVVWVESYTRAVRRRRADLIENLCVLPEASVPDGLAVSDDGDLYITATRAGGIDVVRQDGSYKGFIQTGGVPTNCAFDGNTLYVTDGGSLGLSGEVELVGRLWAIRLENVTGMPPFRGQCSGDVL